MADYSSILALVNPDWLFDAIDSTSVREAIEAMVPALGAGGRLTIEKCKVKLRVLGRDGRWIGSVPLLVAPADHSRAASEVLLGARFSPPARREGLDAGVSGEFGEPGWACAIPELGLELTTRSEADEDLPARALLVDADRAAALLQRSVRTARPEWAEVVVTSCVPDEARHKLGSRSTVRYEMAYGPESMPAGSEAPPALVVAKTYRSGAGTETFDAMRALWDSPLRSSSTVRIAEPLAYDAELNVLVQGPVPEDTSLKDLVADTLERSDADAEARLGRLLERSAAGLAEVHACGVTIGSVRDWADELADMEDRIASLVNAIPALEGLGRPLLDRARDAFDGAPLDRLVPSHGGFRPAQVLIAGDEIAFVDFDSFCQADPAMDLAELVRFVVQEGFGEPDDLDGADAVRRLAVVDDLTDRTVDAYRAAGGVVDPARLVAWMILGWVNRLLGGWAKGKTDRLAIDAHLLDHFVARNDLPSEPFAS